MTWLSYLYHTIWCHWYSIRRSIFLLRHPMLNSILSPGWWSFDLKCTLNTTAFSEPMQKRNPVSSPAQTAQGTKDIGRAVARAVRTVQRATRASQSCCFNFFKLLLFIFLIIITAWCSEHIRISGGYKCSGHLPGVEDTTRDNPKGNN